MAQHIRCELPSGEGTYEAELTDDRFVVKKHGEAGSSVVPLEPLTDPKRIAALRTGLEKLTPTQRAEMGAMLAQADKAPVRTMTSARLAINFVLSANAGGEELMATEEA